MATQVSELDFAKIKENLKTHLKSQSKFKDYDFDGSSMNIILDLLAYTTHYMGVHANMAFSERFLDSANLRSSVVSIAKQIGYFPRQRQGARGKIRLSISPTGNPASIDVPTGTEFIGKTTLGASYSFVTTGTNQLLPVGNGVYSSEFDIIQGIRQESRYDYDSTYQPKFVIEDKGIDGDTIEVLVKDSPATPDAYAKPYTLNSNITNATPDSLIYFIQENSDGKVEISFGDGVLGRAIKDGEQIIVKYLNTVGPDANSASNFELVSGFGGYSVGQFTTDTVLSATGGSLEESISSIKANAPKIYKAQGRAVTPDDYKAILLDKYGWIQSINVWGGEDAIPSQFGRVFISVKPDYGDTITQPVKDEIETYLQKFKVAGIRPIIVDANFILVNIKSVVKYAREFTNLQQGELEAKVSIAINNFFSQIVKTNFDSTLNYSRLVTAIDSADASIVSNDTKITLSKRFVPNTLNFFTYVLEYGNELVPGTVISKEFSNNGRTYLFKDDSNGNLDLYESGQIVPSEKGKHKVDYTNGIITISAWKADSVIGDAIEIEADIKNKDVVSVRNVLITEGTNDISSVRLG